MSRVRLQFHVSEAVEKRVRQVGVDLGLKKGKAILYLVRLASEHMNIEFNFDAGRGVACTTEMSEKLYESYRLYRREHGLDQKTDFMANAVQRGLQAYDTGNRTSLDALTKAQPPDLP